MKLPDIEDVLGSVVIALLVIAAVFLGAGTWLDMKRLDIEQLRIERACPAVDGGAR